MAFELLHTKRAVADIQKLDIVTKKRLGRALKCLVNDPLKQSVKLSNPSLGTYRYRAGDYRVIFDIKKTQIIVLRVGHRKDIYR